jgi:hypothetical protein
MKGNNSTKTSIKNNKKSANNNSSSNSKNINSKSEIIWQIISLEQRVNGE